MDYSLPHAVLAFLQEEHSPNLPKSYFISSNTKSTKITLIYTRRKSKSFKAGKNQSVSNNSLMSGDTDRPQSRYSSSSTDDYTQRTQSLQHCKYGSCDHTKMNRRICASTPGRGYNRGIKPQEMHTSSVPPKMATDPVVRNSPGMKDSLSLNHFTSNNGYHEESDVDDNFGTLSPSSFFGDRPPTPGRDLSSSNSPRPPTPNASNYASLMSSTKYDVLHMNNSRTHPNQTRQQIMEYNENNVSRTATNAGRSRSTLNNSSHSRKNAHNEIVKQTDGSRKSHRHLTTESHLFIQPPITVRSPSPEPQIISAKATFSRDVVKR